MGVASATRARLRQEASPHLLVEESDREERRALHREDHHRRDSGGPFHRARSRRQRREEEGGRDDAGRTQAAEERDRDRGVAVARSDALEETPGHAGDLHRARETRECAREGERDGEVPGDGETREARRDGIQSRSAEPQTEARPRHHDTRDRRGREGQDDAGVDASRGQSPEECGRSESVRLRVVPARFLEGSFDRPRDEVERDEVEQNRRDHLVHAATDP
jgi:hypothetical protein